MAVDAICFDLDGVLADTEPVWERVRRHYAVNHGGTWTDALQEQMMGVQTGTWAAALGDAIGRTGDANAVAQQVIADLTVEYRRDLAAIPGATRAVRQLARQWRLGLVSGSPPVLIDLVLELMQLRGCFEVAMSADEVAHGKPDPDPYLGLAKRLDVSPDLCVAVEDSANGIRSARSAGMRVIAIPRGAHQPSESVLRLADRVMADITELTAQSVQALARQLL